MQKPRLVLLGNFQIQNNAAGRTRAPGRKTQALLGYLAASPAQPRSTLAEWFCTDADDPFAALRWHLSRIRAVLGTDALTADNTHVMFNPNAAATDWHIFTRLLDADVTAISTEHLQNAIALYQGEFLRDLNLADAPEFELWLLGERARLNGLYERGLTELLERATAARDFKNAILRAKQLLANNPLLEYAHARLIWAYAETGQRAAAQQQYEYCRDLMRHELAVDPSPELQTLARALVQVSPQSSNTPRRALQMTAPEIAFVGRARELDALTHTWNSANAAQRIVFVQGAAGSGKSALVREFAQRLEVGFLYGKCVESAQHLPYRPWLPILETRLHNVETRALEQLPPLQRDALAQLLPALSPLTPHHSENTVRGLDELILQNALVNFLLRVPPIQPTLLCLDDLQWADRPSLALLDAIVRKVAHMPHNALVIGIVRAEESASNAALLSLLDDYANAPRITLEGLDENAASQLIGAMWHTLPPAQQTQTTQRLARATGGNPLFLIELVRELSNTNEMPVSLPVPGSTRQLIARRLRRFPESNRQVLEALAVANAPLSVNEIQTASARTEDETVNALDLGLSSGLLQTDFEAMPARYFFAHDLLREAVVAQQSDARRRQLHRRLAKQFAQHAQHLPRAERETRAERIQYHAQEGQAFDLVWEWAPLAAARAERIGAYPDALAALEQAERAHETLAAAQRDDVAFAVLLLDKINVLQQLGRWQETNADLERVAALLDGKNRPRARATLELRRAATYSALGQYDLATRFAQSAYDAFLAQEEYAQAADALSLAARVHMTIAENPTARTLLERALALWRTSDDARATVRCLTHLGLCQVELGQLDSARAYLEEALAMADQNADVPARATAAYIMAHTWNMYGHRAYTRQWTVTASALFQQLGSATYAARAELYFAAVEFAEGKAARALESIDRILRTATATGDVWLEGWAMFLKGSFALLSGSFSDAETWLGRAYRLRAESGEPQNQVTDLTWLGLSALAQNNPSRALEFTMRAIAQLDALRNRVYVWETPRVLLVHAQALDANGSADAAQQYLARAQNDLDEFAARIADPALREIYFASPLAGALLRARADGKMPPLY